MESETGHPMQANHEPASDSAELFAGLSRQLIDGIAEMAAAEASAKTLHIGTLLDISRRLLETQAGAEFLYQHIGALDDAGIFQDSDWDHPDRLLPALVSNTLQLADVDTATLECLSELRMLAIAEGLFLHPGVTDDFARHFLHRVMVFNLSRIFDYGSEAERNHPMDAQIRQVFGFIISRIGYEHILDKLVDEIWRILRQRPLQVSGVKTMIVNVADCLMREDARPGLTGQGAQRLVSALFSPTVGCQEDPGLDVYAQRLAGFDDNSLLEEAAGFARAMHDTGLASPYHAVLLRFLINTGNHRPIPLTLGLSSTGQDVLLTFQELVYKLIEEAIFPATSQAIYGLSCLLERGILFSPPLAPALWRQINLPLSAQTSATLETVLGSEVPARVHLLAGVLNVLGLPLGVGQGNNPTCQSARAISMWAYNNPDYLLQLITWAARDNDIFMRFEDHDLASSAISSGLTEHYHLDLDPVSMILVPHLDKLYAEMGRLCADRGEDSHKWINPEFHGRWVGRGFGIAVDISNGQLKEYDLYIKHFFASYHPLYNGNKPVIYPQPAGIAVTDSHARFVGWHAITIMRVGLDQQGVMRVYFFNPNNDSGQDWGNGTVVSTFGNGESYGESSLPFNEFLSRTYIYHYDPLEKFASNEAPDVEVAAVRELAIASWAKERVTPDYQANRGIKK